MIQAEAAKKRSLQDDLQQFLKREGYGELPVNLELLSADTGPSEAIRKKHGSPSSGNLWKQSPDVDDAPTDSTSILTKGVTLWMGGIARILTGPQEEMDLVKRLMQDEKAKLELMKANAEIGVFGRELTHQERDAAWGTGHDDRLLFLRPAAEISVLGHELAVEERGRAWDTGPAKTKLAKSYSSIVKKHQQILQQTLLTIRRADERIGKAASRPQSAVACSSASRQSNGVVSSNESLQDAAMAEAQARFGILYSEAEAIALALPDKRMQDGPDNASVGQSYPDIDNDHYSNLSDQYRMVGVSVAGGEDETGEQIGEKEPHEVVQERATRTDSARSNVSFGNTAAAEKGQRSFESSISVRGSNADTSHRQMPQNLKARVGPVESQNQTTVTSSAANFGSSESGHEIKVEAEEVGRQEDGEATNEVVTAESADGNRAEVLRISTAPDETHGAHQLGPEDEALQQRISMYTDVDVEFVDDRPGTSGSMVLRPRTGNSGLSRPQTGFSGDRPQTFQTNRSGAGRKDGPSRPPTGEGKLSGRNSLPGSRGQSRGAEGFDLDGVRDPGAMQTVDIWSEEQEQEELDAAEVNLSVSHETGLWSLNSLLKFMENVDPKKMQEKAKKDAEDARRAKLKIEARKRSKVVTEEKEPREVYDVDKPDKDVDVEIVQNILFMLDQLEATTNPGSEMFGQSADVLTRLGNERICRRNVAFPARGIPSLNFLVIETIKPYLKHPEKEIRLVTIASISKMARPGDPLASQILGELAGDEDPEMKAAAVSAISAIATADDGDDEEDMKNPQVRKMLTMTIKAASKLVAADASGTSDPFATIALQAFDAHIDEIKTMQSQNFGSAKELLKSNLAETMDEAPSMVELALKRMLLKKALLLEVCTECQILDNPLIACSKRFVGFGLAPSSPHATQIRHATQRICIFLSLIRLSLQKSIRVALLRISSSLHD